MVGLPSGHTALGAALLVVGALLAAAVVARAWRGSLAPLRAGPCGRPLAALAAASLWTALALAPFTTYRIVDAIRYSTGLPRAIAQQWPDYHNYLDPSLYAYLRRTLPADATFYAVASPRIEPLAARGAFESWPLATLLPRRAVDDPRRAEWLITWDVDPHTLASPLASVRRLPSRVAGRPFYVARVAHPS